MAIVDELIAVLGYDVRGDRELERFNRGLDNAERKAQAVANRINTMAVAIGSFLGTVAAHGAMRLGSAIGAMPGQIVAVGSEFEKLETTLITIEGSSEKAKASLDWVQKFAKTTPYDLQQVAEGFVRLRAYGLDPMGGQLESIGNAASAMGKSLMQGVEAIADAAQGENERLKEFGIRAKAEGDSIVYTWQQNGETMTKTVRKDGTEIVKALTEIFDDRFGGAMERQSKTYEGMISNLGDSWTGFLKLIGEKGYYDTVKRRLGDMMDGLSEFDRGGGLDRAAQAVSDFLSGSIDLGIHVGKQLFAVGQGAYRAASGITELISRVTGLNSVASAGVLGAAVLGSSALGRGMMMALARRIPALGALLLVDDILTGMQGGDSYIGKLEGGQEALDNLKERFTGLAEAIQSVGEALGTGLDWSSLSAPGDLINDALITYLDSLAWYIGKLSDGYKALAEGISDVKSAVGGGIDRLFGPERPDERALPAIPRLETSRDRERASPLPSAPVSTPRSGRIGPQSSYIDDRISAAFANAQGNLAKMQGGAPVEAVANDNSVDNRNQSVTVNSTVNQTIQQPSAAPAAVGAATNRAVAGAAPPAARLITGNAR